MISKSRTGLGTHQTLVAWPALASPGSSSNWDPGLGLREETGAAEELGADPGPSSQNSQLHPLGVPQLAPPPTRYRPGGSFPRKLRLDLGLPR